MSLQNSLAFLLAKTALIATRVTNSGGGSALPGLIAQSIAPNLLVQLSKQVTGPTVCVSGTNGKTTTANLLASTITGSGKSVIHNKNGSNLERGIISSFIQNPSKQYNYAVFECDEAALTTILPKTRPAILVLTNLFRDQLDRYGEIESTRRKWQTMLDQVSWPLSVIYNAADPQLHALANNASNPKLTFTPILLTNQPSNIPQHSLLNSLANIHCPQCNHLLAFTDELIIGQGTFFCQNCKFQNTNLSTHPIDNIDYQVINLQLAQVALNALGINHPIKQSFAIFGRGETIKIAHNQIQIILIKNPNGAFAAISQQHLQNFQNIIFALNDNFADGTDVSWIWDIPLEEINLPPNRTYYTAGTRAADMALRLKYLDLNSTPITNWELLDTLKGDPVIFATYTAMLDLQNWLAKNNYKKNYWR